MVRRTDRTAPLPPRLKSGTRIVLLFVLFAAAAFAAFRIKGGRVMAERPPDTPVTTVRTFVQADNTTVGLVGGIRSVRPLEVHAREEHGVGTSSVSAVVVGARDSGRLLADLEIVDGRWQVVRAAIVLSDGRRLPLATESAR